MKETIQLSQGFGAQPCCHCYVGQFYCYILLNSENSLVKTVSFNSENKLASVKASYQMRYHNVFFEYQHFGSFIVDLFNVN